MWQSLKPSSLRKRHSELPPRRETTTTALPKLFRRSRTTTSLPLPSDSFVPTTKESGVRRKEEGEEEKKLPEENDEGMNENPDVDTLVRSSLLESSRSSSSSNNNNNNEDDDNKDVTTTPSPPTMEYFCKENETAATAAVATVSATEETVAATQPGAVPVVTPPAKSKEDDVVGVSPPPRQRQRPPQPPSKRKGLFRRSSQTTATISNNNNRRFGFLRSPRNRSNSSSHGTVTTTHNGKTVIGTPPPSFQEPLRDKPLNRQTEGSHHNNDDNHHNTNFGCPSSSSSVLDETEIVFGTENDDLESSAAVEVAFSPKTWECPPAEAPMSIRKHIDGNDAVALRSPSRTPSPLHHHNNNNNHNTSQSDRSAGAGHCTVTPPPGPTDIPVSLSQLSDMTGMESSFGLGGAPATATTLQPDTTSSTTASVTSLTWKASIPIHTPERSPPRSVSPASAPLPVRSHNNTDMVVDDVSVAKSVVWVEMKQKSSLVVKAASFSGPSSSNGVVEQKKQQALVLQEQHVGPNSAAAAATTTAAQSDETLQVDASLMNDNASATASTNRGAETLQRTLSENAATTDLPSVSSQRQRESPSSPKTTSDSTPDSNNNNQEIVISGDDASAELRQIVEQLRPNRVTSSSPLPSPPARESPDISYASATTTTTTTMARLSPVVGRAKANEIELRIAQPGGAFITSSVRNVDELSRFFKELLRHENDGSKEIVVRIGTMLNDAESCSDCHSGLRSPSALTDVSEDNLLPNEAKMERYVCCAVRLGHLSLWFENSTCHSNNTCLLL